MVMSKVSNYAKYAKVIKLDEATYNRLATVGRFKETYAGIINRLIDMYEKIQIQNLDIEMKDGKIVSFKKEQQEGNETKKKTKKEKKKEKENISK